MRQRLLPCVFDDPMPANARLLLVSPGLNLLSSNGTLSSSLMS